MNGVSALLRRQTEKGEEDETKYSSFHDTVRGLESAAIEVSDLISDGVVR